MFVRVLTVAMSLAILAAAPSALAQYVQSAAPASEKPLTPQQQKMKDCGAQWQTMKKDGKTQGQTWAQYRKECMKKSS